MQRGNEAAFTELYERFWPLLYRHAYRMLKDEDEATDVIQEVFTSLWSKAAHITLSGSFSSYLYSSVRNKVLDKIYKTRNQQHYLKSLSNYEDNGTYVTDEQILERELARRIEEEIANLPQRMRITFELSRKQHLSYKEIADATQTTEGTVKKQIYNALKILRPKFYSLIAGFLIYFM